MLISFVSWQANSRNVEVEVLFIENKEWKDVLVCTILSLIWFAVWPSNHRQKIFRVRIHQNKVSNSRPNFCVIADSLLIACIRVKTKIKTFCVLIQNKWRVTHHTCWFVSCIVDHSSSSQWMVKPQIENSVQCKSYGPYWTVNVIIKFFSTRKPQPQINFDWEAEWWWCNGQVWYCIDSKWLDKPRLAILYALKGSMAIANIVGIYVGLIYSNSLLDSIHCIAQDQGDPVLTDFWYITIHCWTRYNKCIRSRKFYT